MGVIIVDTLLTGSLLALVAVGMTMVFSVVGFANVAQVEFATLAAYGTLLMAGAMSWGLVLDGLISMIAVGIFAVGLYHVVFVRLLSRSPATAMIGSLAVSILLRAALQTVAGTQTRSIDLPLERGQDILGAIVTPTQLKIMAIGIAALVLLMILLRFTPLGRLIRAVSANPDLAAAAGIDVKRVINVVWFIAGVTGALGGILLAVDTQVNLEVGFSLLLPVFAAVMLGGFGSPGGAIVGAFLLAFTEAVVLRVDFGELFGGGSSHLDAAYRPAIGFVLLLLVLIFRPQGVLGRATRGA